MQDIGGMPLILNMTDFSWEKGVRETEKMALRRMRIGQTDVPH